MNKGRITIIIVLVLMGVVVGYFGYIKVIIQTNHKKAGRARHITIDYYHCGMHPWITSNKPGKCPICGMDLVPVYHSNTLISNNIITIDPTIVQNIGVKTEQVNRRKLIHTIRTIGRVDYDETQQHIISTRFSGWITKLYADYTGKVIQKGEPLFDIYSPELVTAQQEYLEAIHYSKVAGSNNDLAGTNLADDLLQSAQKKLIYLGLTPSQIKVLEQLGHTKKEWTIYSLFSGVITEKNIVEGMDVATGANLLKLENLDQIWIYADVYENEISWLKHGDQVTIELPNNPDKVINGKVSYIYPFLQYQTHTAKVRIEYADYNHLLKEDMYVTVNIIPHLAVHAIAIPEQAIIHSGNRDIVVKALGGGKFMSVDVVLGVLSDDYQEVKKGLNEGDTIVTSSQFLIDSESNLKISSSLIHNGSSTNTSLKAGNTKKHQ